MKRSKDPVDPCCYPQKDPKTSPDESNSIKRIKKKETLWGILEGFLKDSWRMTAMFRYLRDSLTILWGLKRVCGGLYKGWGKMLTQSGLFPLDWSSMMSLELIMGNTLATWAQLERHPSSSWTASTWSAACVSSGWTDSESASGGLPLHALLLKEGVSESISADGSEGGWMHLATSFPSPGVRSASGAVVFLTLILAVPLTAAVGFGIPLPANVNGFDGDIIKLFRSSGSSGWEVRFTCCGGYSTFPR